MDKLKEQPLLSYVRQAVDRFLLPVQVSVVQTAGWHRAPVEVTEVLLLGATTVVVLVVL